MTRFNQAWNRSWLFLVLALAWVAAAQATCDSAVGRFVSLTGSVDVQGAQASTWRAARLDTRLCEGDTIRVGERSRAAVSLINDAVLRIDQNTAMRLTNISSVEQETSFFDLVKGAFQSFSRKPKFLRVNTPYLNGSVEGTEFVFRVNEGAAELLVLEGSVRASNDQGSVSVDSGEVASAASGAAPAKRIVVKPRALVQWSIYYPPVISDDGQTGDAEPLVQASHLLAAGRVEEANRLIDSLTAGEGQVAAAHALRSVIAVAQNDVETALGEGRRAVELDGMSSSARIALSYALQARLDLAGARDQLLQATGSNPDDALAWARLGELYLAEGKLNEAVEAASRSVELAPALGRARSLLGFAFLARIRAADARSEFEQAVVLDSNDPLPRLGLGLARIRQGELSEGRAELEAAIALDSNNAVLRAYLGKAYFEEKRGPLDAVQFTVAKHLDPNDPTAYLYDGIRLQTENRPVQALAEFARSIQANDNRAVYRSRLLLDKDRAARGTSQARVYSDLGFTRLGIGTATKSLGFAPGNAASHRFLSDSYRGVERHEVSRVSELLQAQLLQDININPVQPSTSAANLNLAARSGPARAGFNEFTPLFERNEVTFNAAAALGSNDTASGEGVFSAIHNNLSASAGTFAYESDGFRSNNDLSHDIKNLFIQAAITPGLNVQVEYGDRETEYGDLAMHFDPNDFQPIYRRKLELESWRFGARISPNASSDILLSFIDFDRQVTGQEGYPISPVTDLSLDTESASDGDQLEAQYLFDAEKFNVVIGAARVQVDRRDDAFRAITTPAGTTVLPPLSEAWSIRSERIYGYVNLIPINPVEFTLGVGWLKHKETNRYDFEAFSPKVGVRVQASDALTLRAAYFQGMKPVLSNNRMLEPTQVAGFNQFFDDNNATLFTRYGVGGEYRFSEKLTAGAEMTWRDFEVALVDNTKATNKGYFEDRDEATHRLYGYWTPTNAWAVSAELEYDEFSNFPASALTSVPQDVETWHVPLLVSYFHPSGWTGTLGATYVDQTVDAKSTYRYSTGDSTFVIVDASVAYRLPRRQGIVSLSVNNLFDKTFNYLDNSYRSFQDEPTVGRFLPDRSITASFAIGF